MGCAASTPDVPNTGEIVNTRQQTKSTDLYGDSGVGKSALMKRFADDTFKGSFMSTVGIDFWDTAGQERFRTITKTYYRGAHGYILVYDVSNQESFSHVKYWLGEIKKNGNEEVYKMIVGNKADLSDNRTVSYEEGKAFAASVDIPFIETSAKEGLNVEDLFVRMTRGFLKYTANRP